VTAHSESLIYRATNNGAFTVMRLPKSLVEIPGVARAYVTQINHVLIKQ